MQTTGLPGSIHAKIDHTCRHFIQSGKKDDRIISLVNWGNVCLPKTHGGLGFNELGFAHEDWLGLISTPSSFWVKVLCTKYSIDHENLPPELPTKDGSHLWKSVGEVWNKVL